MNIDLLGKNAFVGGSSKGIGKAAAVALAKLGANVTLAARSAELLSEVKNQLDTSRGQQHDFLAVDYDNIPTLRKIIKNLILSKSIHILINNTGGPKGGMLLDADNTEFEQAFKRHIITSQLLVGMMLDGMKKDGYGRIINVISTSVKEPISGLGVSNTIRGAMGNWAKTLASELGTHGITVNNVLPGFTDTERLGSIIAARSSKQNITKEAVIEGMKKQVPMGRFASAEEIANAIAFLASPAASYINGINVPVDGGRTRSL